ncbi:MAG: integrase core domain-containing protein [Deinococcales bacterium]
MCLAVAIDAFARPVVSWSMSDRMTSDLVVNALNMALRNRQPELSVVHQADQGAQYTALSFGKHLERNGVFGSMGAVGSALDDAMAESFFASLQTELLNRNAWRTRGSLKAAIFHYIEVFYNRQRQHTSLEYLPPLELEVRQLSLATEPADKLQTVHHTG